MPPTYEASAAFGSDVVVERDFLRQVFAWMFLALALTTGVAIWFHQSNTALRYFQNHHVLFLVALFAPLVMVLALQRMVLSPTISVRTAAVVFFAYAALNGLIFSILLDVYTTKSVVGAFAGAVRRVRRDGARRVHDPREPRPLRRDPDRGCLGPRRGVDRLRLHRRIALNLVIGYVGVILFRA